MSAPFFFAGQLAAGAVEIMLDEESSRHIVQVLRMKRGEKITLTDGRGGAATVEISDAHKKHCTVHQTAFSLSERRSPTLTIAISLTKNAGRFEWFLEKAAELGTAEIIPLICERTEKQHARHERLVSICKSAMLQSSQVWMPHVHQPISFKEAVNNPGQQQRLFGHISGQAKDLASAIDSSLGSQLVLIGPEGDFSEAETALAQAMGFEGVSFGPTILRVETAGIYAAAVHAAFNAGKVKAS